MYMLSEWKHKMFFFVFSWLLMNKINLVERNDYIFDENTMYKRANR